MQLKVEPVVPNGLVCMPPKPDGDIGLHLSVISFSGQKRSPTAESELGKLVLLWSPLFHTEACERDLFVGALIAAFIETTGRVAAEFDQ
jgi:hypothetical protein